MTIRIELLNPMVKSVANINVTLQINEYTAGLIELARILSRFSKGQSLLTLRVEFQDTMSAKIGDIKIISGICGHTPGFLELSRSIPLSSNLKIDSHIY